MSKGSVLNDKQRKKDDKEMKDLVRSVLEVNRDEETQVHPGAHDEEEEIGT